MVLKMVLGMKSNQLPKQKVTLYGLKIKNENLDGIRITEARKAVFDFLDGGLEAEKEEIISATGASSGIITAMIKSGFLYKKDVLINEEAEEQKVNLNKTAALTEEQQAAADILVRKVGSGFSATLLDLSLIHIFPTQRQKAATFPFAATASCGANKPHQPIPLPHPVPRQQTEQPIHIRQHKQKPRRQKADRTAASDY